MFLFFRKRKEKECSDNKIERKLEVLAREIRYLRRILMATKQEVLDAIAAEKAEVTQALNDFSAQIQALKDQLAQGTAITAADLDDIENAVHDIFVPPTV